MNARAYFEKFAKEAGFDPLVPEGWYQQKKKHLMTLKVFAKKDET
jgi:hypothetical protein